MDGMGSSLRIGRLPPKKLGTVAVSEVQGQKSHQWLLQKPLPFLYPNYTRFQKRQHGKVSSSWIYPAGTCVLENSVQTERAAGQHTCCAQFNFCLIWGLKSLGSKTSVQTDRRSLLLCCKNKDTSGTGSWKKQLGNKNYFCRIHLVVGISICYLKHLHTLFTSFL